ncbi:MAG: DUF1653 domain-containing protein [Rickettsiaceae bacterium]|nr:DUF1653 domain-containing protein [Rickettsiaceae bacterium]
MIKPGLYEHYKGQKYEVIGMCRHSETLEELVVYRALYGDYRLWVRPHKMFTATVTLENRGIPRFKFLGNLFEESPKIRPLA